MTVSAIYQGHVVHTRFRPVRHRLKHRLMWMLLDLDELPMLSRRLRLFSLNRFNLVDFRDRDHGDGSALSLIHIWLCYRMRGYAGSARPRQAGRKQVRKVRGH